jgi:L-alanine-DL-glutamate epimerase-like enolase superfamily enzyme
MPANPRIIAIRPVLLSAPYAEKEDDLEVILHLPSGWRTTGLVEITLDNGVVGLGEGYLAVFAPHVFRAIVDLVAPVLLGGDPHDLESLCRRASLMTGYWSFQGAAQHVISAIEIALQDCRARLLGVPLWRLLGGKAGPSLRLYASGGDGVGPEATARELDRVRALGIDVLKIRARHHQADRVRWCVREATTRGIRIAVDMTQNLVIPSQTIDDIERFLREVSPDRAWVPAFLEEALGPEETSRYPELRARLPGVPIAGGEIVTTSRELRERLAQGCYAIAQPDATVIGGVGPVLEIFGAAHRHGSDVYVHCWGGPVGMMANYHAALAGGGTVAEWPMKSYPLRDALVTSPWQIESGTLTLHETPGLGVALTPEIERAYAFRDDAVYQCLVDPSRIPKALWP